MRCRTLVVLASACFVLVLHSPDASAQDNPVVMTETNMGTITIELFQEQAPISVENFLAYVDAEHYDNTVFHRVIQTFMIQGGTSCPTCSPSRPEPRSRTKRPTG